MDTFSVKERKPSASSLNIKLPSNKLEVELYTKNLAAALAGLEKSGYYNFLVESLITKVCLPLTADETRKIATLLQTQEKDKREKAKKSSKKSLYGGKTGGKNDMTDYGNENLYEGEYDDFM